MEAAQVNETPRHSVSVAAAIFDDSGEKVLLIKRRDNGNWEPPGGVLELDETIEDGLRREVREETGAEIEVGPTDGGLQEHDSADCRPRVLSSRPVEAAARISRGFRSPLDPSR